MAKRIKRFSVTGAANSEVLDSNGIQSSAAEKRKVTKIFAYVSGQIGNQVVVYLDQDKIISLEDYFFITDESSGSTNTQKNTNRIMEIEIDRVLEEGEVLKAGINSGATAKNLIGGYEYEVVG